MNIAENNVVSFIRPSSASGRSGYPFAHHNADLSDELIVDKHSGRGLLMCVLFSAVCWVAIAFAVLR